jgi:hypothetical protein
MRRPSRSAVLIGSLAVLALWIAIDSKTRTDPAVSPPIASDGASRETAGSAASTPTPELPARAALGRTGANPFSPKSWFAPSAKPAPKAPEAPPAPSAPPFPFRFSGQLLQGAGILVFLSRGDEFLPVKEGDTLDGQYKVESLTLSEATFVHLPSGVRQTLEFGPPLKASAGVVRPGTSQVANTPAPAAGVPASPAAPMAPISKNANAGSASGTAAGEQPQEKTVAQPAQLRWEGPQSARAGANFSVTLRVTSAERIRSAPMQLKFDPALLESVSVRPGRYFGNAAGNFGYRINPDGSIFVGISNQSSGPASDAELVVLTFKPIRPGAAAEVSVASLNLQGAAGRAIAYNSLTPFKTTIAP